MSDTCPTVRIKSSGKNKTCLINEADFDPAKHELADGEPAPTDAIGNVDPIADKGDTVEIPDDWEKLHWRKQVALALEIIGGDGPLVPAEGQTEAEKAKAIIASEVAGKTE
jgi:hypothetical protein